MELGIHLPRFAFPDQPASIAPTLARTAALSEAIGATSLHLMDHWFQMEDFFPADEPMLEGYTGLGFLAAHTSTIRLGLLVTGVTYRHPGLLAKTVTTLDVLSGGRAICGIGAAWYEREHKGLGVAFPPVAERFERLEECLQICLQMWDPANTGPYEGRHYQLAETLCSPLPLSRPHPPVMIGGSGERKTLRLVARYGDACNLFVSSPAEATHKLDVLRRHCDDAGRDEAAIAKTMLHTSEALNAGDVDGFVAEMAGFAKAGIDQVIVMPQGTEPPDVWIERNLTPAPALLADLG